MKNKILLIALCLGLTFTAKATTIAAVKAEITDYTSNPDINHIKHSSKFQGLRLGFDLGGIKSFSPKSIVIYTRGRIVSSFSPQATMNLNYRFSSHFEINGEIGLSNHKFTLEDANLLPVSNFNNSISLGRIWLMPTGLSLRYVPLNESLIQPYVGLGAGYLFFMGGRSLSIEKLNFNNVWRLYAELGLYIDISPYWYLSLYVKQDYNDRSNMSIDFTNSIDNAIAPAQMQLNSLAAGIGISYRF